MIIYIWIYYHHCTKLEYKYNNICCFLLVAICMEIYSNTICLFVSSWTDTGRISRRCTYVCQIVIWSNNHTWATFEFEQSNKRCPNSFRECKLTQMKLFPLWWFDTKFISVLLTHRYTLFLFTGRWFGWKEVLLWCEDAKWRETRPKKIMQGFSTAWPCYFSINFQPYS